MPSFFGRHLPNALVSPSPLLARVLCAFAVFPLLTAHTAHAQDVVTHQRGVYAFENVRLVDGIAESARADIFIVVEGDRIVQIGEMATAQPPAGATIVDVQGKTLLPGLIMMHEHLFYPIPQPKPSSPPHQGSIIPRTLLASGVTTARTAGTIYPLQDLAIAKAIEEEHAVGPDLIVTMPFVDASPTFIFGIRELGSAEEVRSLVDYWARAGARSVKVFMNAPRDYLQAAVDVAHRHGIKVTGHLCAITFAEAAQIGIDNLEHGFSSATDFVDDKEPDACPRSFRTLPRSGDPRGAELIQLLVDRDVAITLTPAATERSLPGAAALHATSNLVLSDNARAVYKRTRDQLEALDENRAARFQERRAAAWRMTRDFAAAGGRLMVGADVTGSGGVVPGPGSLRSLELIVEEGGFTPMQAVLMATRAPADYLERENIGRIEVGAIADFVIVDGKPDMRISDIREIAMVFKRGVGYSPTALLDSVRGKIGVAPSR